MIKLLECKVNELEQYSRKDNLIITGIDVRQSYARITSGETGQDLETDGELKSVEEQVVKALNEKGIELKEQEISACHLLGKKGKEIKKEIKKVLSLEC